MQPWQPRRAPPEYRPDAEPVSGYAQGMAWKTSAIGRELEALLDKRGVKINTWIWQAGGCA